MALISGGPTSFRSEECAKTTWFWRGGMRPSGGISGNHLLLDLNSGVGSEFLLASDSCLARRLEFFPLSDLIEQRVIVHGRIHTKAVLQCGAQ